MKTAEYDLRFLASGIEQLESFLLSNDIYRSPGIRAPRGAPPYPQFTLGWMLLSLKRAQVRAQSGLLETEFDHIQQEIEKIRVRWRVAWERKAKAEFSERINLWRDFLMEYRMNPEGNVDRYGYEVNRRVLLELLGSEVDELPKTDITALAGLDRLLRTVFVEGEFVWDADLSPGFPKQTYWYLYGTPKTKLNQID